MTTLFDTLESLQRSPSGGTLPPPSSEGTLEQLVGELSRLTREETIRWTEFSPLDTPFSGKGVQIVSCHRTTYYSVNLVLLEGILGALEEPASVIILYVEDTKGRPAFVFPNSELITALLDYAKMQSGDARQDDTISGLTEGITDKDRAMLEALSNERRAYQREVQRRLARRLQQERRVEERKANLRLEAFRFLQAITLFGIAGIAARHTHSAFSTPLAISAFAAGMLLLTINMTRDAFSTIQGIRQWMRNRDIRRRSSEARKKLSIGLASLDASDQGGNRDETTHP